MQGFLDSGSLLWAVVGGDLDGNMEGRQYVVNILPGHGFRRESLFFGRPADNEAGEPAGDEDICFLPVTSAIFCLCMGKNIRANR